MKQLSDKLIEKFKSSKLPFDDFEEIDFMKLAVLCINVFADDIEEKGVNFKAQ